VPHLGRIFFFSGRIDQARLRWCLQPPARVRHSAGHEAPDNSHEDVVGGHEDVVGGHEGVAAMVCGPPAFSDEVDRQLREEGIGPEKIHYEKWW